MTNVGDVIRVACRQKYDGIDDQVNVMHWVIGTLPTPDTDAALMADIGGIISSFFGTIQAQIVNNVTTTDLTFYNVSDDSPIGQTAWPGTYNGGTGSGEGLPLHDSALLLLPTNVKRTIGRIYLPTMLEASQNDGLWVAAVHTAVDAAAGYLLTTQEGPEFGAMIRYAVWKRSASEYVFPTSARLVAQVAVQTRRKRGRGS